MTISASRRGFTLIELMVVISIVAVLAVSTMSVLSMLQRKQKVFSTKQTIEVLGSAATSYLAKFASLGMGFQKTGAADFRREPYAHLYLYPSRTSMGPLIDLPLKNLVTVDWATATVDQAVSPAKATHVVDAWGYQSSNIINWSIIEGRSGGRTYLKGLEIRSSAGTPGKKDDDIIYRFIPALDADVRNSSGVTIMSKADAGKFVWVDNPQSDWNDPIDSRMTNVLDSTELQAQLNKQ
jgi:prepilin-type N-terminal cleavage/methylation domain-containing protein